MIHYYFFNRELDDETGTSNVVGEELDDTSEEDEARVNTIVFKSLHTFF